jgi:hypothetical protein
MVGEHPGDEPSDARGDWYGDQSDSQADPLHGDRCANVFVPAR